MPTLNYDTVLNAAYDADLDEDAIRNYSGGRGMSPTATCFGITHDGVGELLAFIVALDHAGVELDFLKSARQDGMGHNTITYFPGTALDGAPDDDEEDET